MQSNLHRAFGIALLLAGLAVMAGPARAQDLDLSAYRGRVVYLDFWASWCAPCRLSFPWMNELQQMYGNKGLVVIAVNVDHDHQPAEQFLKESPPGFKIVFDPDGRIASRYDIKDMPTTVLIGRDGKVHYVHSGFFPGKENQYLLHVNALLGGGN